MNEKDIQEFQQSILRKISEGRLRDAISDLRSASEHAMMWETTDRLNNLERNYTYMLNYFLDGVKDADRKSLYESLVFDVVACSDMICRKNRMNEAANLYFSHLRVLNLRSELSIKAVLDRFATADDKEIAGISAELFKLIWVKAPLTKDDLSLLSDMINDSERVYPYYLKTLVLFALALGLLYFYDEGRFVLLLESYVMTDDEAASGDTNAFYLSSIALCGVFFGLLRNSNHINSRKLADRIKFLSDSTNWKEDMRLLIQEWIRVNDTDRISKKMADELIPGFKKISPDLLRKIKLSDSQLSELQNISDNPEWDEMLRKSGIMDKMRELSEIQQEGGDVFMGTFSHLKHFPFFSEISNWFAPFTPDAPYLLNLSASDEIQLAKVLMKSPFLCDSDKYSFVMSLSVIPEAQRAMLQNQVEAQAEQIMEASRSSEASLPSVLRRTTLNRCLQNMYRFFRLFRRKSEFFNPFNPEIILGNVPFVSDVLDYSDTKSIMAEMYFKFGMYKQAYDLFEQIDAVDEPDAIRYQKMGYCQEILGDLAKALELYERAELLAPDSQWTMRRIATCARATRSYSLAIKFFEKLQQLSPDDTNTALLLGFVYTEAGRYEEAIAQFYKVEFLKPDSKKAWRGLAWNLFLTSDYEASCKYYAKIIQSNPTTEDYLNMGHVELILGNIREAVNFYRLSISSGDGKIDTFIRSFDADRKYLERANVEKIVLQLVVDETVYSFR